MKKNLIKIISAVLCGMTVLSMAGCNALKGDKDNKPGQAPGGQVRNEDIIFVGDSRFVGMKEAVSGYTDADVEFVAEVGQGLYWLKNTAPGLYGETGKTIVFNLGVNDLYNASGYIDFYNSMPQDFIENNTLVIMTVNPVDEQKGSEFGYAVTNAEIESFNSKMINELDKLYFKMIDSYTYLKMSSFKTVDGIHYNNETYRLIYDYAVECCGSQGFMKR